jgi:hypothetical protein
VSHALAGQFPVDHSARLLRNYRYAAERSMRALGGWIALTPELPAKLLLGRHVWDLAQHADAFGKRLPELRAQAQTSEPPNARLVAFMDALEEPEQPHQTVERLVGVYRVLKPHVLAVYLDHLGRANPVYEPPTRRILLRCVEDERRHIAAGEVILRHLVRTPALVERASVWQGRLEGLVAAAGGATGDGLPGAPPPAAGPALELVDDALEWIRLAETVIEWPISDDLRVALASFGAALVARDEAALGRWLAPEVVWDDAARAPLHGATFARHDIVAFSRVGRQCLVKVRLDGPTAAATLLSRWAPSEAGWRVAALEVARADAGRPDLPRR